MVKIMEMKVLMLFKYNNGEVLWTKQFGTIDYEASWDVAVSSDGNVYVTGETNGNLDGQDNGGLDGFRKYGSDGKVLWTKQFGILIMMCHGV